ncbi:FHA domain-containing protein [Crateriforma conspicua]|uniref:Glycogen accumulation regulator GarA n=1 Tax=Crateriforma conspicua TaxID=2527996 RepID=A0A5C6FPN4_9PLAN|nr:FHA domain-containing protein [Crateriforma conspicua]TWU65072.1 Glycogen accumulation regulator GarA [Crateriforma conspicua]
MNAPEHDPASPFRISLVSRNAETNGSRYPVDPKGFVIGRHDGCHLRLKSRSVSRRHCQIAVYKNRVVVCDLESRNGTLINGARCKPKRWCLLWHGDTLKIGKRLFRVSVRDAVSREAVTPDTIASIESGSSRKKDDVAAAKQATNPVESNKSVDELFEELEQLKSSFSLGVSDDLSQGSLIDEEDVQPSGDTTMDESAYADTSAGSFLAETAEAIVGKDDSVFRIDPAEVDEHLLDEDGEDEIPKVGKLPDHIKHRRTVDSKNAAEEALKRFFEGR